MRSSRNIEWFSIECRKTEAKEITLADHKKAEIQLMKSRRKSIYVAYPRRQKKCKSVTIGSALNS